MKKGKAIKVVLKENILWCDCMIDTLKLHDAPETDVEYFKAKKDAYEDVLDTLEKL